MEVKRIQSLLDTGLSLQNTNVEKLFQFDLLEGLGQLGVDKDIYSNERVARIHQLRKEQQEKLPIFMRCVEIL